jgi:hypothetical protein
MDEWERIVAANWGAVTIRECPDVEALDEVLRAMEVSAEEAEDALAFIAAAHGRDG